jgi:DNA mismatch repair ATPase MutS
MWEFQLSSINDLKRLSERLNVSVEAVEDVSILAEPVQAVPRLFSTDADGKNEKEFLTDFFPTMSKMATNIFLKRLSVAVRPAANRESAIIVD